MFNQQEQKMERKKLSGNGNQLFFVNILIMEIGETDFTVMPLGLLACPMLIVLISWCWINDAVFLRNNCIPFGPGALASMTIYYTKLWIYILKDIFFALQSGNRSGGSLFWEVSPFTL